MRVFLASTGQGMSRETRDEAFRKYQPRYVLETFFNGEKACLKAMQAVGNDNFLLDSGAFSYMNGQKVTLEQMEAYVDRYIDFIVKYKVKHFIEIDVDNIFGLAKVEEWRRKMERTAGRQCIPVWHKGRGVEYWKKMCREYKYVAIGGLRADKEAGTLCGSPGSKGAWTGIYKNQITKRIRILLRRQCLMDHCGCQRTADAHFQQGLH